MTELLGEATVFDMGSLASYEGKMTIELLREIFPGYQIHQHYLTEPRLSAEVCWLFQITMATGKKMTVMVKEGELVLSSRSTKELVTELFEREQHLSYKLYCRAFREQVSGGETGWHKMVCPCLKSAWIPTEGASRNVSQTWVNAMKITQITAVKVGSGKVGDVYMGQQRLKTGRDWRTVAKSYSRAAQIYLLFHPFFDSQKHTFEMATEKLKLYNVASPFFCQQAQRIIKELRRFDREDFYRIYNNLRKEEILKCHCNE